VVELAHEICHVADMNSWFHTATLAKLKTPIGSPDLREIHQLYTGQVPDMTRSLTIISMTIILSFFL